MVSLIAEQAPGNVLFDRPQKSENYFALIRLCWLSVREGLKKSHRNYMSAKAFGCIFAITLTTIATSWILMRFTSKVTVIPLISKALAKPRHKEVRKRVCVDQNRFHKLLALSFGTRQLISSLAPFSKLFQCLWRLTGKAYKSIAVFIYSTTPRNIVRCDKLLPYNAWSLYKVQRAFQ